MAKNNPAPSAPFSFEIDRSQYAELQKLRRQLGNPSLRILIEHALGKLQGRSVAPKEKKQQLSVRLGPEARDVLRKHSGNGAVSAGEVVRSALALLVAQPPSAENLPTTQAAMPKKSSGPNKKAVKKTAAKKAAPKKAVKKAAAKKAPAKKAAAKKATVKKAAAKKVPAKKAPAKKAPAKKATTKKTAAKKVVARRAPKKVAKKVARTR